MYKDTNHFLIPLKTSFQVFSFFLLFLLVILALTNSTYAAGYTLSGKITDNSHNPILYSDIAVRDTKTTTTVGDTNSGIGGYYKVVIPQSGIYTITVTPPKGTTFQPTSITNFTISRDISLNIILLSAVQVSKTPPIPSTILTPTRNLPASSSKAQPISPLPTQSQSAGTTPQKTNTTSSIVNIITGILLAGMLLGTAGYFIRKKFFNPEDTDEPTES